MSSATVEMRNAFDQFSLWTLARFADTAATVNLLWCGRIQRNLGNCVLAVVVDRGSKSTSYILLEHHLTKRQLEDARTDTERSVRHLLNLPANITFNRYVHVTNECPAIEADQLGIKLLKMADMCVRNASSIPSYVLGVISTAREMEDALERNMYGICFSTGTSLRQELRRSVSAVERDPVLEGLPSTWRLTSNPMNWIESKELAKELQLSPPGKAPLGLFIVRHAVLADVERYMKRSCVDRLEDVTPSTWFLVSDTVPFETPFQHHVAVHEVVQRKDYGLVMWQRSRGAPVAIGTYFSNFCNELDALLPAPCWLNVLVSKETDGSTTRMRQLIRSSRKTDPFRMVAYAEAIDVMEVMLQQRHTSVLCKLWTIFKAQSYAERFAVDRGHLLLVLDHAFEANGSGVSPQILVEFLNAIEAHRTVRLQVWIVGNEQTWQCIASNCIYASIKHAMSPLLERERKENLSDRLKENCVDIETVLERVRLSNARDVENGVTENVFYLSALCHTVLNRNETCDNESYWWVEVLERYIHSTLAAEGSLQLQSLEKECYARFTSSPKTYVPIPSAEGGKHIHRTVVKLLAAKYIVRHPDEINVEIHRLFGWTLLDLLLFRHSPIGMAVLRSDIDTVRGELRTASSPDALLTAATDCLERNLLHVVHSSGKMAKALLSVGVINMEQRCPLLNHWTPLQLADARADWPIVDVLMAHGAVVPTDGLRLHTMQCAELKNVFSDCIGYECYSLLQWIAKHRPDYLISQEDVYCMVVSIGEKNTDLLVRLLECAVAQELPEREPEPYQFIWYNTALNEAIEDGRYQVAAFLVDKLRFQPTEKFYELQEEYLRTLVTRTGMSDDEMFNNLQEEHELECCPHVNALESDTKDFQTLVNYKKDQLERLDVNYLRWEDGKLLIHYYIEYVDELDEATFRFLLAQYDDVDVRTEPAGMTSLHVALQWGTERIVEILLEVGADVHAKSLKTGASALHFAAMGAIGRPIITRLIEEYGMDVNARDNQGRTIAFHLPVEDEKYCEWMVEKHGLDMHARDCDGQTILHVRVRDGSVFCSRWLEQLLVGMVAVPQSLTDARGRLPLHYAVRAGKLEFVQVLLKHRSDLVDVPDEDGVTPIQLARAGSSVVCVAIHRMLEIAKNTTHNH